MIVIINFVHHEDGLVFQPFSSFLKHRADERCFMRERSGNKTSLIFSCVPLAPRHFFVGIFLSILKELKKNQGKFPL